MKYYTVKNWERFQHYKDRNPPWIKLHYEIMTSADWVMLADASKLLAVVCMLVASRNNGKVPNDPNYFKRVAYLDKLPNLTPLLECGFLEIPLADASTMQADARPETYSTDKEKNNKKEISPEFESFWESYPRQRRGDKSQTWSAWQKAIEKAKSEEILHGLEAYLGSSEVSSGYAKGATAWLNASRWNWDYSYKPQPKFEKPKEIRSGAVTL